MAKRPIIGADKDHGVFRTATIEIDEERNTALVTVHLAHGTMTVEATIPYIAAWAVDNVAGKVLNAASAMKP